MCGIAGIVTVEPEQGGTCLAHMCNAMVHRGPDDWGYAAFSPPQTNTAAPVVYGKETITTPANVFLGHRRLSIIDPAGSRQPFASADGNVWVTFNGEIYNYCELRKELTGRGYNLREQGDTETLVYLWQEFGPEMVHRLRGMFAFALFDRTTRQLFLARDRFGQKPLYYFLKNEKFAFASELGALAKVQGFPRTEDPHAVAEFFRYGYIPSPNTIYTGVHCLRPGHCAVLATENMQLAAREYWRPRVNGDSDSNSDIGELDARLTEAVQLRMRADVPLGVFLSGGIDSSLVTAAMCKKNDAPVQSFTISTSGHYCDESKAAAIIANRLGTSHNVFPVDADFIGLSTKLAAHFGQPFADYSAIPTYYVSEGARKKVKVALGGDGADELFGGYQRYTNGKATAAANKLPTVLKTIAATLCRQVAPWVPVARHLPDFLYSAVPASVKGENITSMFHRHWRETAFQPDFQAMLSASPQSRCAAFESRYKEASSDTPLERWLETDQRLFLCDDILTKVDIASMAVSLECRAPFLDHVFAEWVNNLPSTAKIEGRTTKLALRRLAARNVDPQIARLPKKGFTLPLSEWMRGSLREWTHAMLFENGGAWRQYIKPSIVERLWQEHQTRRADHSMKIWQLVTYGLWKQIS